MKKLAAFIFVMVLGLALITYIDGNVTKFAQGELGEVSEKYIDKNVNGDNQEIIYGETKNAETGSANIVTSIIANYRSFDTLGEVTVLFISALGIALVLGNSDKKRMSLDFKPNFMLRVGSKSLFAIIILVGISMAIHGHLTPGGGFPGGAMISAGVLLLYLADDNFRANIKSFKLLEGVMGSLYVVIGLVGLYTANYFLINFMNTGVVGELFSAGIVPVIYVIIGLKVGAELTSIIDDFMTGEVN